MKKKTEVKQPEAAPEAPREVPKLKHVDRVKESSPARSRSGSPIPQLKRVEQQKREESPFSPRGQSPIPKLKPVPKKEAVPEKVSLYDSEIIDLKISKESFQPDDCFFNFG